MPRKKRSYRYEVKNWRTYNEALCAVRLADDVDASGLAIPIGSATGEKTRSAIQI